MNSDEKNDKQWLKKLFEKKGEGKKKGSVQYIAMILCAGVALMILGSFFSSKEPTSQTETVLTNVSYDEEEQPAFGQKEGATPFSMEDYEIRYENQLKEVLEEIIGVSNVSIMINLAETEKNVFQQNNSSKTQRTVETDREGGQRNVEDETREEQTVILRSGDKEEPLLVKKEKPDIRGVLVVAEGVENMQVKSFVVESVSRVLDVPPHRVSVMPKKLKEE